MLLPTNVQRELYQNLAEYTLIVGLRTELVPTTQIQDGVKGAGSCVQGVTFEAAAHQHAGGT